MAVATLVAQPLHLEAKSSPTSPFNGKKIHEWKETKTSKQPVVKQKVKSSSGSSEMEVGINSLVDSGTTDVSSISLFHNDGMPISTNIVSPEAGVHTNSNLFAVADYEVNDVQYRSYYFADTNTTSIEQVKEEVAQDVLDNSVTSAVSGTGDYLRTYNWSFYNPSTPYSVAAKLTANVELKRGSTTVDINGRQGSVWDVKSTSQIENYIINPAFVEWTQRLSTSYSAQTLIDYGPETTSSSTVTVGLSGYIPGASWTFSPGGFKIIDSSSFSSKYGRWTLKKNLLNPTPSKALMKPGIRVSNTTGNLGIEMSHTYTRAGSQVHSTGVVSIFVADR